jgi:hypothetical protein
MDFADNRFERKDVQEEFRELFGDNALKDFVDSCGFDDDVRDFMGLGGELK